MTLMHIEIDPVAKARAKVSFRKGRGFAYTPKKTKDFELTLQALIKDQFKRMKPYEGAISLQIDFYFARPKSVKLKDRLYPSVKPDIDNYAKAVMDACNKVCWEDDSQVIDLRCSKRYAPKGLIFIKIKPVV